MPPRTPSFGTALNTDNLYSDVLCNIKQLLEAHVSCLDVNGSELTEDNIVTYDDINPIGNPFISIVFVSGKTTKVTLGACMEFTIDLTLYYYFESLSFGNDTKDFLAALWRLTEIFIIHPDPYHISTGTGIVVNNSELVGRHLDSDAFLTGQVDISVPIRVCRDDHQVACP